MQRSNKAIIWDWNGTLLDDVLICIKSINHLLKKRNLPLLTLSEYRDVFTFPVRHYYEKLGFDFNAESFEKPAWEFIDQYTSRLKNAGLHIETHETLKYFKDKGYGQFIISAMEHEMLVDAVEQKGISDFFVDVLGIKDIYAHGKTQIAGKLLNRLDINTDKIVLVGDTLHDHEVASFFGLHTILVSHGHQSLERLRSSGAIVKDNFLQIIPVVEEILRDNQ